MVLRHQDPETSIFIATVSILIATVIISSPLQRTKLGNIHLYAYIHTYTPISTFISISNHPCIYNNVVVQSLSRVWLFATPWNATWQAPMSSTISWGLLKLVSIELVILFNHLILHHPLLLLPSVFPSIRVFSSDSALRIRWPKYWSFSFSIIPSNEYSGLISFRTDWFDLLAVQETLKSLFQHHSSKASVLQQLTINGPTLTSIHDYWKNHSFDSTDLCWQSSFWHC